MNIRCIHCGFEHVDAAAKFCSRCGALAHHSQASTWSIFTDWSEHYIGSHGALWRTLRQLLFQPGALTQAYFSGVRGLTLRPIQVYLLVSLVSFFLVELMGTSPVRLQQEASGAGETISAGVPKSTESIPKEPSMTFRVDVGEKDHVVSFKSVEQWLVDHPFFGSAVAKKRIGDLGALSREQRVSEVKRSAKRYLPIIALLLVPLLAGFTKLVWNPRLRFAEHLVFALHFQAFLMLVQIPLFLSEFLHFPDWLDYCVLAAALVWIWLATRRVFGRSKVGTAVRLVLFAIMYALSIAMATALILALALFVG